MIITSDSFIITTLSDLASQDIDMHITIVVNSQTFVWQDRMITPRGYVNNLNMLIIPDLK
jgi:precorrin-3B methylase